MKLRVVVGIALLEITSVFGLSCSSHGPQTETATEQPTGTSEADRVAAADQLYSQREDLSKVRMCIAELRQARIADYGNYEAAWKLSRAAYYLGEHTTDETEREKASAKAATSEKSLCS